MNIIFNELKQFIVKETKTVILDDDSEYFDLKKTKQYIICYFDEFKKLIMCDYTGYFNKIIYTSDDDESNTSDDDESNTPIYYFDNNQDNNISVFMVNVAFALNIKNFYEYKFYELEDNFNLNIFKDIHMNVIKNLKLSSLPYTHIKISLTNEFNIDRYLIYDLKYKKYILYLNSE